MRWDLILRFLALKFLPFTSVKFSSWEIVGKSNEMKVSNRSCFFLQSRNTFFYESWEKKRREFHNFLCFLLSNIPFTEMKSILRIIVFRDEKVKTLLHVKDVFGWNLRSFTRYWLLISTLSISFTLFKPSHTHTQNTHTHSKRESLTRRNINAEWNFRQFWIGWTLG